MRRELDPTYCQETVFGDRGFNHQCLNKPVVTHDGKLYCKIHDPEYIKAKRAAERAKWGKERAERQVKYALQDARRATTEGLTLEELKQVTPDLIREKILAEEEK